MKHKVSELKGVLLDAAVWRALGDLVCKGDDDDYALKGARTRQVRIWSTHDVYGKKKRKPELSGWEPMSNRVSPSGDWSVGGPIIERERIGLLDCLVGWEACAYSDQSNNDRDIEAYGRTPLIAAMRAFVASKFGEEVDL